MEKRLMALAEADGRGKAEVQEEEAKGKAVIAAKTGNLSVSPNLHGSGLRKPHDMGRLWALRRHLLCPVTSNTTHCI